MTIKDRDLEDHQGTLTPALVTEAIDALQQYLPAPTG